MRMTLFLLGLAGAFMVGGILAPDLLVPERRASASGATASSLARNGVVGSVASEKDDATTSSVAATPGVEPSFPSLFRAAAPPLDVIARRKAETEPTFSLAGLYGAGKDARAVIRAEGVNVRSLAIGEDYSGWTLQSVDKSCAAFGKGKLAKKLCL